MDFAFDPSAEALRAEIRVFLAQQITPALLAEGAGDEAAAGGPAFRAFYDAVLARGWIAASWPVEYGGQGRDLQTQYVIEEEFWRAGFRIGGAGTGAAQILSWGSEAQKRHFLPRLIDRRYRLALALTEPGAGTDLAGVSLRAERGEGGFVLTGEKWLISNAAAATHLMVLARSEVGSRRKAGLSAFLVPVPLPGLHIEPLTTIQSAPTAPTGTLFGHARLDRVTFDEVAVPDEALLGTEGEGWRVMANASPFERCNPRSWISAVARVEEHARHLRGQDDVPDSALETLGALWIDAEVTRLFAHRCLPGPQGRPVAEAAAMETLWAAEQGQRAVTAIAGARGPASILLAGTEGALDGGLLAHSLLGAPVGASHHGGTRALRDQIARSRFGMAGG